MVDPRDTRTPTQKLLRALVGVIVFACITTGVAFIYWPAALIVAGVLLALELVT